jgi:hypothetical protein
MRLPRACKIHSIRELQSEGHWLSPKEAFYCCLLELLGWRREKSLRKVPVSISKKIVEMEVDSGGVRPPERNDFLIYASRVSSLPFIAKEFR